MGIKFKEIDLGIRTISKHANGRGLITIPKILAKDLVGKKALVKLEVLEPDEGES
jgi:hypothetical protein